MSNMAMPIPSGVRDVDQAQDLIKRGLGTWTHRADGVAYLCTSVIRVQHAWIKVWTAVPEGMTPEDLGRRFSAAYVDVHEDPR